VSHVDRSKRTGRQLAGSVARLRRKLVFEVAAKSHDASNSYVLSRHGRDSFLRANYSMQGRTVAEVCSWEDLRVLAELNTVSTTDHWEDCKVIFGIDYHRQLDVAVFDILDMKTGRYFVVFRGETRLMDSSAFADSKLMHRHRYDFSDPSSVECGLGKSLRISSEGLLFYSMSCHCFLIVDLNELVSKRPSPESGWKTSSPAASACRSKRWQTSRWTRSGRRSTCSTQTASCRSTPTDA